MTSQQQGILWIGIAVVLIFLFTDQSFRDSLFNRGTTKTTTNVVPFTLADIVGVPATSNSAPTGTVKVSAT